MRICRRCFLEDIRIYNRLVSLRKKKGYTQMELSKLTNLSQQYISNIERGVTVPSLPKAIVLANALGKCCGEVFYIK